jgi:iron complex outermembrane receptor protein
VPLLLACGATFAQQPDDFSSMSLEQLLQVNITGASKYEQSQGAVAAAVSVITRQEIKAFGWRRIDEALNSLPGIHTTNDLQGTQLGARGFGLPGDFNTRVLVLLNGNRINDTTYDTGVVNRNFPVDIDLVERIEFIPGPGGAVYGQNAMFGVVNVITRQGSGLDGAEVALISQPVQNLREVRASWGTLTESGVDVLVSVSGLGSDGEDRFFEFGASGVSGVATGLDGERNRQIFARIARGAWSLEHAYGGRNKKDPTGSYFSDPLRAGQFHHGELGFTQLKYEGHFADDTLQLSARVFLGALRYRTQLYYAGESSASDTNSKWRGAELRLVSTAVAGHTLMGGIEAQDDYRSDQLIPLPLDPTNSILISDPGHRLGLFVQDEWQIRPNFAVTLGLRNDSDGVASNRLNPRAALIWQATPATVIKTLYGRAHREPNAFERFYDDGATLIANPTLGGERIDTLELVADHRVSGDLTVRASLYRWNMRGLIALGSEPVTQIPQYQTGEDVRTSGLELSADKTWDGGYRLRGSLSMQDANYTQSNAPLLNSPALLGSLNLSAPLQWLGAGLRGAYQLHYGSERLTIDGTELSSYTRSDLIVTKESLAAGLDLSVAIYNLFDQRYSQPGAPTNWQNSFEQDGRSLRVGLSYGFGR